MTKERLEEGNRLQKEIDFQQGVREQILHQMRNDDDMPSRHIPDLLLCEEYLQNLQKQFDEL